jgi:hypothetical protein
MTEGTCRQNILEQKLGKQFSPGTSIDQGIAYVLMLVGWCSLTSSTLLVPLSTTSFRLFVDFRRVRGGLGMEFVGAKMMVWGDLIPTEGEVRRSQKLRIGTYAQHFVDLLTMVETPVQYLLRLHPDQEGLSKQEAVRTKLGKFGLPSHNHLTPIAK